MDQGPGSGATVVSDLILDSLFGIVILCNIVKEAFVKSVIGGGLIVAEFIGIFLDVVTGVIDVLLGITVAIVVSNVTVGLLVFDVSAVCLVAEIVGDDSVEVLVGVVVFDIS